MEEGLSTEHGSELDTDSLEELLDCCGVSDEGGTHLQSSGRDIAHSSFNVVGDPIDKVRGVLVLDVQHLFVDLLHRHSSAEDSSSCKVSSMSWITGCHHVLRIEHLLCQLGHSDGTVLLVGPGCERGEAGHEEVESGEWHHVDGEFPQIRIQLSRESEASGHS